VLLARAQVVYASRNQATCQCSVFVVDAGEEKLVAVAQGTINRLPEENGRLAAQA
jgi:acyl-coenzyme A thioesterase PaaI-like protein